MDKRISKTKRNLKNTLRRLLRRKPLSSITVTELCKDAETSRITFYTHYNDKYDLASEMVRDIVQDATDDYNRLQHANNPQGLPLLTVENTVDAILDSFERNIELRSSLSPKDSVYLKNELYNQIVLAVTQRLGELLPGALNENDSRRFALFLCAGFNEYLGEGFRQGLDPVRIRRDCKYLAVDLFRSIESMVSTSSGGRS